MRYWLLKSEPNCFSLKDLSAQPGQTTHWDGVRNYQARNMLRDEIKAGDKAFFYYSNCKPPGIAGIVKIVKSGYADFTAFDPDSDHFDPTCTKENPRWFMVDVKLEKAFNETISLNTLKSHPALSAMQVARKGNRLSVTAVTSDEWHTVLSLI